ncbi:UNVERIFIED_CONTAM: hypothetical protein PYX00_007626 [Menopon gallinae]|uniref:UDP-glucuronosyltransferase n=1 Tax=Menopon gallinae TaxID=328185 RepID=A0AAW2HK33_9NEOP
MGISVWVLAALAVLGSASAANVLVVVPTPAKSHHFLLERLALDLAERGHRVTFVTSFRQPKPVKNLEEVIYPDYYKELMKSFTGVSGEPTLLDMHALGYIKSTFMLHKMGLAMTDMFLSTQTIRDFIRSDRKYDLVIGEAFFIEAVLAGFSKKYDCPLIALSTNFPSFYVNYMVGNPSPSAYIPSSVLGFSDDMTFIERTANFLFETMTSVYFHSVYLPAQDSLMRKHFGNGLPPIEKIMTNTSLVLVNHHSALAAARPYLPNMVEIGGYHVRPPKPLPEELKKFMDNSKNGVILFSMGSHAKSTQFPREKQKMFVSVFAKLKQNVLWKFEDDSLTDLPDNLKIMKWVPQSDVLAHPNIKLFITHGGLLSTTEALSRGVPLLGLPIFGDQPYNMAAVERSGFGKKLSLQDLDETVLYNTITEMLSNKAYKETAMRKSVHLNDRLMPPAETAVFWIEYVIRHKGAPHMRCAAVDLEWYELYLIDVFAVIAVAVFLAGWLACRCTRAVCRAICCRKPAKKRKTN